MLTDKIAEAPIALFISDEPENAARVTIHFEERAISVPAGVSVAAALLLSGLRTFRSTPVSDTWRAPYCMMGVCFECLLEIDGKPSRQSCLTQVREGMVIKRQYGASALAAAVGSDRNAS